MNRLEKIFFSTRTMAMLLLIYAFSMAAATFVENDFDTATAKTLIYNSKWFELLMVWLMLNFVFNIKTYRLYRREKWPLLVFHLAFIVIFIGGALTRYFGFEGKMNIPEGETTNEIISDQTYFKLLVNNNGEFPLAYETPYMMSHFNSKDANALLHRTFKGKYKYEDKLITLTSVDFVPRAKDTLIVNPSANKVLKLVSIGQDGRKDNFLQEGDVKSINGVLVSFNKPLDGTVQIKESNGKLTIKSPFEGNYMKMQGQEVGVIKDSALLAENSGKIPFNQELEATIRTMYNFMGAQFVIPNLPVNGNLKYYSGDKAKPMEKNLPGAIELTVSDGNLSQNIWIVGGKDVTNYSKDLKLGTLNMSVGFGSAIVQTPFSIRLDDFKLTRYPGSTSPSSFESNITVIDEGKEVKHHIYMNNVMDYKGYRFFQSSYFPNEQGTVLSVNQDSWGTNVTYLGYFFLFTGMFVTLFWKGTRFWQLNKMLVNLKKSTENDTNKKSKINLKNKTIISLMFLALSSMSFAQHDGLGFKFSTKMVDPDSLAMKVHVDKGNADLFGKLMVQDFEGRMKPLDTQALEILRKIYKSDTYHGLDANQWFVAIQLDPQSWINAPIIRVSEKGGESLKKLTGANDEGYTTLMNLIDLNTTRYKLDKYYNEAFSKRAADRTEFDNEIINITERFNIIDQTAKGYQTKIIPVPNDPGNKWTSWVYATDDNPVNVDTVALAYISKYFNAVNKGRGTGDWKEANQVVKELSDYQHKWGKNVMPSETKVNLEVFYNHSNIFFYVMIAYSIISFILIFFAYLVLFYESRIVNLFTKYTLVLLIVVFAIHGFGLGLRWYISGHAPWSNGYEAIIFISWIGVLAGLLLYKNRNAFIPANGAIVAVIMMGFAHGGSLLNPQITPLVPVLKSYWLMVHVGIITSSYGFFGLGGILSIFSLIMLFFKPTHKISASLKEMSIVSEMSLTIGLFLLTVGTFLGGMWANESWGRYWSWDPKETWAFISVMVYAFVLHMRLVPGLRSVWAYNVASMWALSSVIMTYFGVNYYLTGLHTYAAGDSIPIPAWVPITASSALALTLISYYFFKKNKKAKA